jgi:hypothetical protein
VSAFGLPSASVLIGVPSSTSQLRGCSTLPVRVTMREITGSPWAMARQAV